MLGKSILLFDNITIVFKELLDTAFIIVGILVYLSMTTKLLRV